MPTLNKTITYNSGGFASGASVTDTQTSGSLVIRGALYTRQYYIQQGWTTFDTMAWYPEYKFGQRVVLTEDLTLYPAWRENIYYINFDGNAEDAENVPDSINGRYDAQIGDDYTVQLPADVPTRDGYSFDGWSINPNATIGDYPAGGNYSFKVQTNGEGSNVTLYAIWRKTQFNVSYKAGTYGVGAEVTDIKTYDVDITIQNALFTRSGYRQVAWSLTNGGTADYDFGDTYDENDDLTLYPVWEGIISTLSANDGTLGVQQTLTINSASLSFTHDIDYLLTDVGGQSQTIVSRTSASTVNWIPPLSLANSITSATSCVCTFFLTTYDNGVKIGESTKSIYLSVPNSVKVSISSVSIAEAVSGLNAKIGAFVQGQSKLSITTNISTANAYGATRTSTVVSLSGNSSTQTLGGSPVTSGVIQSSGTVDYESTIRDTRGRSDTYSGQIIVLEYGAPSAKITSLSRNSDGTEITVGYKWGITALNNRNDKTVTIKYRQYRYNNWNTAATITPNDYSGEDEYTISNLTATVAYEVQVIVSDYFTETSVQRKSASIDDRFFDLSSTDGTIAIHGANPNNNDGYDKWQRKPVRFYKPVDFAAWRSTASLSSSGWYRAVLIEFGGTSAARFARGISIDIAVGSVYNSTNNMLHRITLNGIYDNVTFTNETSVSNTTTPIIDKIRYTYGTDGKGHIDVHYSGSSANTVFVDYRAHCNPEYYVTFSADTLETVSAAPSGETVVTTYTFGANGSFFPNGLSILNNIGFEEVNISASSSTTISFASSGTQKKMIVLCGVNNGAKTVIVANCANAGTVTYVDLNSSSSYTITTGTRSITIANGTTSVVRGMAISF